MPTTVAVTDLRRLLTTATPFADKGPAAYPILGSVLLRSQPGHVLATATDRLAAIVVRGPATTTGSPLAVVVPLPACRHLLAVFPPRGGVTAVTLTQGADTAGQPTLTVAGTDDFSLESTSVTVRTDPGDYPALDNLIVGSLTAADAPTPLTAYAGPLLAKVARLGSHDEPVTLRAGAPRKATVFSCGDDILGVIMPTRSAGSQTPGPDVSSWQTMLDGAGQKAAKS